MQFKFKIQPYQTAAAEAVVRVFEGQPRQEALSYIRDLGVMPAGGANTLAASALFEDAEGFGNAPVRLDNRQLLDNIHKVQAANNLNFSPELFKGCGACTLDVEMETGTGKTYVYTKTMFELNKHYGWTKFIIVVPSVAIREGVEKSLQTTEQHFFEQYGKRIWHFVYNSDRLSELDAFAESADISCMIINMQAFNTSMKEGAKNDAARIIFSERDEFRSRRPIDVIAANNPIVIIDEPQKMGKKDSATQLGIARFRPLFCLCYSATHAEQHDMVYALDALDAYNQRLVKRIEVKGFELKNMRGTDGYLYLKDIVVSKTKPPEAVIEFKAMGAGGSVRKVTRRFAEGDSLYEASGAAKLEVYKDYVIASGNDGIVPDIDGRLGYVRFLNGEVLMRGEVYGDSTEDDMRRIQIRETIASHLQKEEALFARGIKCLSLFFIDEVAKYRAYGQNDEELTVGYGKIFEEEYESAVQERLAHPTADDYLDNSYVSYLASFDTHEVHAGYFSVDKKNPKRAVNSEVKRGAETSDDIAAYDLILKNKERLLSFEEPVRFIFSHSALREGWDNPNVFQLCTLKTSASATGKRQEVGRGLRLCVNQNGERQDAGALGEHEVQRVNVLTVIASEGYSAFVDALQKDVTLRDRPVKVTQALFEKRTVIVPETGKKVTFAENESTILYHFLVKNDFIDEDAKPTEKFRSGSFYDYALVHIKEELRDSDKLRAAEMLVKSVYDPNALRGMVANGNAAKVSANKLNDNFRKREFQELWSQINHKYAYTVDFEGAELIAHAVSNINERLEVSELAYAMTVGAQRRTIERSAAVAHDTFDAKRSTTSTLDAGEDIAVKYDLIGEVAKRANITRKTAAAILRQMSPLKFALFRRNPEEFIKRVGQLIVDEKAAMIVDHVTYHQIEGTYDSSIFTERMPANFSRVLEAEKSIQDYVFWDSEVERTFAKDLDIATEVCVYAKLPRSLKIPTPVGDYAPDWAIAFNRGAVRHVFFVAETKGTMNSLELRGVEDAKIACARKVFNEASTDTVRFAQVSSYEDLLRAVRGME